MSGKTNNYSRKGLIDGLPNSYTTSYILTTNKCCELCNHAFTQQEIDDNQIVCFLETFNFYHKNCLDNQGVKYSHQRENDKSSMAKIIGQKIQKINTSSSEV